MRTSKKRILYFMPDNTYWSQAGNLTRTKQLLQYFEDNRDLLQVDFLSSLPWTEETRAKFASNYPHITLYEEGLKGNKKNRIKYFLTDKLPKFWDKIIRKHYIDLTTPSFRKRTTRLIEEGDYDYLLISYTTWGTMVESLRNSKAYKIIDTHDFITLQYKENLKQLVSKALEEEINILSLFDEIWTYSVEEEYIFNQFTEKKVTLMPVSFPERYALSAEKEYDLLYVASNNQHNIRSIEWFIHQVLPLLSNIRLHMVGHICKEIADHPQLVKLGMVEDLDDIYKKSKLTICPMLSGTGVKIKILESISYGLPVVTSRRGVDGLINKINNGCLVANDEKSFAQAIIKLLSDEAYYQRIAQQAREFHRSFYTTEKELAILDSTFKGI